MAILRVTAEWTGWSGAPGYNVFHFGNFGEGGQAHAQLCVDAVRNFYEGFKTLLPVSIAVRPESTVELIDEATGRVQDIYATTPGAASQGSYTQGFSAPSGMLVHWETAGIRNGRRVRGKTFLVPLGNAVYENNGTIAPAQITAVQTPAQALIDNAQTALYTWSRPKPDGTPGEAFPVLSARVPDKAVILRSRRD